MQTVNFVVNYIPKQQGWKEYTSEIVKVKNVIISEISCNCYCRSIHSTFYYRVKCHNTKRAVTPFLPTESGVISTHLSLLLLEQYCANLRFSCILMVSIPLDTRLNTLLEISCVTEISWLTQYESQNVTDIVDIMWLWTVRP